MHAIKNLTMNDHPFLCLIWTKFTGTFSVTEHHQRDFCRPLQALQGILLALQRFSLQVLEKETFVSLTRRWEKFDSVGSVWSCKHHACYWDITTIFLTFYMFCARCMCWCGLNCLQNAAVLLVWPCLFAWAQSLPVCCLQQIWSWLQFQWTKEL